MINKRDKIESYRDLIVWQKSHELAQTLYKESAKFSKKEYASLAEQIRESVSLIPINIAIGFKKRSKKVKIHFYRTALSAIEQTTYFVILTNDLGLSKSAETILEECETIEKMLRRLIRSNTTPPN